MKAETRRNFRRLLNPTSIAFIGGRDAIVAINEARRRGYSGRMWGIHPSRSTLDGVSCFPTLYDLPEVPDAAYVAIPSKLAVGIVADLSAMGAGGVVCYSAGFKEAGQEGEDLERELRSVVGDLALIGPNCYGVINYIDNSALWSFPHGGESPGYGAAIITQSGMFSSDITMSQRSLPMAYMISSGNQAVMGQEDFVDFFSCDPAVRAIGLHIEGLNDIRAFEKAALKALKNNKPIVVLKTGTSSVGETLTLSHTGSLSGANELYEALFERVGVVTVTNPSQLIETLKYFCIVKQPKGKKIAGFTCSGGGATMLADHAEKIGLEFPLFTEKTTSVLKSFLPEIATVSNPLDYTTPIWGQPEYTGPVFRESLSLLSCDAAILVQDYPAEGLDESKIFYQNDAKAFAEAARSENIPAAICSTIPENLDFQTRNFLIENRVAPMQGIHEALNALSHAAWWQEKRTSITKSLPKTLFPGNSSQRILHQSEAEGKHWLKKRNVSVPEGILTNGIGVKKAAEQLGFPVVLKMMGRNLVHKTEAGAVCASLFSKEEVENAAKKIRRNVAKYNESCLKDEYLVEKMLDKPLAELIVGVRRDKQFGYALTIGAGGIFVDLMADVKTILLPCEIADIRDFFSKNKVGNLLSGFRGAEKANLDGISKNIHELCLDLTQEDNDVEEIEINPLFVYPDKIVAIDVLLRIGEKDL